MKPLICTFLLTIFSLSVSAIDTQWEVELSDEKTTDTKDFNFCRIMVTCTTTEGEEQATVNIDIQNLSNSRWLLVFDRDYTENELKAKSYPSYRFGKGWGTHTQNGVIGMKGLERIVKREMTTGPEALIAFSMGDGEEKDIEIPAYLASVKGTNKLMIEDMQQIGLHIKVHTKKDMLLPLLSKKCDDLLGELQGVKFYNCPWTGKKDAHYKTVEKQQEAYKERINALIKEIEQGREQNNYKNGDKKYVEYQDLIERLGSVKLDDNTEPCPRNHSRGGGGGIPPAPHSCTHCKAYGGVSSVGNRMEKLYIRYDNGDKSAKTEAQRLYNALNSNCPVLKGKWGSADRNKADNYYKRMK